MDMIDSVLEPRHSSDDRKDPSKNRLLRSILMGMGALALLGLGGMGVYTIAKQRPELLGIKSDSSKSSEEDAQKEIEALVAEIGDIMELPQGESPTLATVTDLEQVKSQPFFSKAQNGDKVLVYAAAKRAILYRPSEKKIIEVGAVNIPTPTLGVAGTNTEATPTQTIAPTPTVGQVRLTPTIQVPPPQQ